MANEKIKKPDDWWVELYENISVLKQKFSVFYECLQNQQAQLRESNEENIARSLKELKDVFGNAFWLNFLNKSEGETWYIALQRTVGAVEWTFDGRIADHRTSTLANVTLAIDGVFGFVREVTRIVVTDGSVKKIATLSMLPYDDGDVSSDAPRLQVLEMGLLYSLSSLQQIDPVSTHIEKMATNQLGTSDSKEVRANTPQLFPNGIPKNTDIVDLVLLLNTESTKDKKDRRSGNEIAREFTREPKGSDSKAQSLLAQIRRLKKKGDVNL